MFPEWDGTCRHRRNTLFPARRTERGPTTHPFAVRICSPDRSASETPLDIESEMEVAPVERRALVCRRDVLIDVGRVAIRDQDLEIVAADDAFESDCPCRIGV